MLSGKCGLVYCHMGAAKEGLQPLMDAVSCSDVPITQFLPTHVERTPELTDAGAKWVQAGGYVNLTCQEHAVHLESAVCQLLHGIFGALLSAQRQKCSTTLKHVTACSQKPAVALD